MAADLETRLSDVRDEVTARTLGTDLQLVTRVLDERLRLQYGGQWYRDWVDADRASRTGDLAWTPAQDKPYPDGSTYDNYGAFLLVLMFRPQGMFGRTA